MSTTTATRSTPAARPSRRALLPRGLALAAALCIGAAGTYAVTAPAALAATVGAGVEASPWLQHLHGHAALHEHIGQVLARAGASDAQRQAIEGIVKEAMQAQHADMARYHAGLHHLKALLAAPQIDAAAIERVRSQQDQLLLDTDRRLTETLVRIARVLTPAQRQALSADIDRMMAARLGHHAGH